MSLVFLIIGLATISALVGYALGYYPRPSGQGLSQNDETILIGVADCGITAIEEMAMNCGESKDLVSQIVRRLTERGLLEFRGGAMNITRAGREALARAANPVHKPCGCCVTIEDRLSSR